MKQKDPDAPAPLSRRALIASAGAAAGAAALGSLIPELGAQQKNPAAAGPPMPVAPADPAALPGSASEALNSRSPFEHPGQTPINVTTGSSLSPLHDLNGTITPSDLVFQRHHNGI